MDQPYLSHMQTFITEPYRTKKEELFKRLNIMEVKAIGYSCDGIPLICGMPAMHERYNLQGALVESLYCLEGMPEIRLTVTNDEFGNQVTTYCYDGLEFHTYDARQKLIERRTLNAKGRIRQYFRYECEIPSPGVEIRREFGNDNKYVGKTVSKSDKQGNVLFTVFFDEKDEPNAKYTYEYDGAFRLVRTTEWGIISRRLRRTANAQYLGLIYSDYHYEYDLVGNLVKKLRFGVDEAIDWFQSEFYRYDGSNRKSEEFGIDETGQVTWITKFTYDLAGNLVTQIHTGSDGAIGVSKSWRYDHMGLVNELVIEDRGERLKNRYVFSYDFHATPS